jgi:predicted GIY-YIG superfamily endonuclease
MFYFYIYKWVAKSTGRVITYTGQTNNIERRLKEHREKRNNVILIHLEIFESRKEATQREAEFKSWKKIRPPSLYKNTQWKNKLLLELSYTHIVDEILNKYCH